MKDIFVLWHKNQLREKTQMNWSIIWFRSSHREVFLGKVVLKMCSKFTGEQPCRSVISIKLLCNFIEITLRHDCSPVNLLHTFRTRFRKDISGWLLLIILILILSFYSVYHIIITLNAWCSVKGHTKLNKPVVFSCWFVYACMNVWWTARSISFHDGGLYHIETSPLIRSANQ